MILGMMLNDFNIIAVETHVGLIINSVLFAFLTGGWKRGLLIVGGVSDPLFLSVPCVYFLVKCLLEGKDIDWRDLCCVLLSWVAVFIYTESSKELFLTLPGILVWAFLVTHVKIFLSKAHNLHKLLCFFGCDVVGDRAILNITGIMIVVIGVAMLAASLPARYWLALTLAGMLLAGVSKFSRPNKIFLAISVFYCSILLGETYPKYLNNDIVGNNKKSDMSCLVGVLNERGIAGVGVDYWLSKPLILEAKGINVIPIDYRCGSSYMWIAPYQLGRGAINSVILDKKLCASGGDVGKFCNLDWIQRVSREKVDVCENYTIYFLSKQIDYYYTDSKLTSFYYQLMRNIRKILGKVC